MAQVPIAFNDGDGTPLAPAYNLRPRNIMPTGWWLWWLARVDVGVPTGFTGASTGRVEGFDGYSVIPDLQRLAIEQQNSPMHAAWFYRFNAEKQWRSRNVVAQTPNQLFVTTAVNVSVKNNSVLVNAPYLRRDINTPYRMGQGLLQEAQPVHVKNYGMMVSGAEGRCPPTWNSFYERIFNIDDVPLQKYGNAWNFTDKQQNGGRNLVQSSFGVNGQGYGLKGIKDLWAIAWRVPNDPSGTPVPLTIEFVMETQIDVEVKHFDAQTDLNGIICRPDATFAVNGGIDTESMSIRDYTTYLRQRGQQMQFETGPARNGMTSMQLSDTMPHKFMMPQSSFAQHVALESDNFLNRLDGAVNPDGQTKLL